MAQVEIGADYSDDEDAELVADYSFQLACHGIDRDHDNVVAYAVDNYIVDFGAAEKNSEMHTHWADAADIVAWGP
jgi:hypothetical protein